MADFKRTLARHRERIIAVLDERVPRLCGELAPANPWDFPVCSQLLEYTKSGKMVRGALVISTYELLSDHRSNFHASVRLGAVMELIQSFLLIHDDVMDRDETRRGLMAIHTRYRELGRDEEIADAEHFGASMSICVGDVAYLLAMRLLAASEVPSETLRELLAIVSREVSLVGVAQMSDLYQGVTRRPVMPDHIKTLYVHKTGRYTFSLPMILGATIAGAAPDVVETLSKVGELLGYVFQLKDDELGVFADQGELGKPIGSDIAANKKTLLRYRLLEAVGDGDAERLQAVFGSEPVTPEHVREVRHLIERTGVRERIRAEMRAITDEALEMLGGLSIRNGLDVFAGLAEYNLERTE